MIKLKDLFRCLCVLCDITNYSSSVSMEWDKKLNKILNDFTYEKYDVTILGKYDILAYKNHKYKICDVWTGWQIQGYVPGSHIFTPFCSLYENRNMETGNSINYTKFARPRVITQLKYILKVNKLRRKWLSSDFNKQ